MITVLLIDLWQTLAMKKMRVFERIQQEYQLPDDAFPFFKNLLLRKEVAEINEDDFWHLLYAEYDINTQKPHLSWVDIYSEITVINNELLSFAQEFRRNGGKAALFSNTDPAAKQYLEQENILQEFDAAFFSFDAKLLKPDSKFIEYVLDKLHTPPEEILYIDDMLECISTAQSYGIQGLVYSDFQGFLEEFRQLSSIE